MAAPPPLFAVPKNLYKHFAVVTVAITFCVALFADGAQREEIAEQISAHQAAKAREMKQNLPPDGRMVGGMRDNRGGGNSYVINNNPDVGDMPGGRLVPTVMTLDRLGMPQEGEQLRNSDRAADETEERKKMLPVLPPGMAPLPGMPGSEQPVTAPGNTSD
jgi:hypothetical protein